MTDTVRESPGSTVADAVNLKRDPNRKFRLIGTPMPVREDRRFVRGRGKYINDIVMPGMCHIAVATAPVAHARLLSVDVSEALKAPGVVAVLTGKEVAAMMEPITQLVPLPNIKWYPLAVDKIRLSGEYTAAVVARSRAEAEDAAELVTIEYEELPPVVDPELAITAESAILHEAHGSNIASHEEFIWGDLDESFANADHVFEYRYRWHRHSGVPIETFGTIAYVDPSTNILDLWASHQNPGLQQELMGLFHLDTARVHQDVDVGGSYGSKRGQKHMYLACAAAIITGRPIKFIEDRIENMVSGDGHGPDRVYKIKVATTSEGILEAIDVTLIEDLGAYSGRGIVPMRKPTAAVIGPYRIKNVRYNWFGALTNKSNQVPFRGAGQSPHNFCLERAVDHIARDLGIDPIEIRRRNYIQPEEFPYVIPSGATYDSGNFPGAMDLALEKAGIEALRKEQAEARKNGRLFGIGIAGGIEPGAGIHDPEGARIEIDRRGSVVTTIGFQSAGQAHESMVTQIVCEELGIEQRRVTVQRGHGLAGIVGGATTGSRMTMMLGSALKGATDRAKAKLKLIAAHALEVDVDDIVSDQGRYHVAGVPDRGLSHSELAALAYGDKSGRPPGMEPGLVVEYVFVGPDNPPSAPGTQSFASYAFDIHIPVVEVDPETFEIKLLNYLVVHDCGTVINPLVVDGFVYGGIGHGVGGALYEHFYYDDNGQLLTASFMDYLCPTASEIPNVDLYPMETPSPIHPYGAKGTAEGAYMTAPAAIASAVEDAVAPLGLEIDELPVTPLLLFAKLAGKNAAQGVNEQRS